MPEINPRDLVGLLSIIYCIWLTKVGVSALPEFIANKIIQVRPFTNVKFLGKE
jgi:hypothetical protein